MATFDYPERAPSAGRVWFKVEVDGLTGGHSGDDIEKGRASATKLLARLLGQLDEAVGVELAAIDGGNLRNAIARTAWAVVGVEEAKAGELHALCAARSESDRAEFSATDPLLMWTLERVESPRSMVDRGVSVRLVKALNAVEHGVVAMSAAMEGLVETSTNLASIKMPEGGKVVVTTSQRSSVEVEKQAVAGRVDAVFTQAGASVVHSDGYPGWAPNPHSALVSLSGKVYEELFGRQPKIRAIHAGLECGLFLERYPALDMVSFGPTILGAHSPDERLEVVAVDRVWAYLKVLLARLS